MDLDFLLTCIAIAATPGTGVLYTVATALQRGGRASLVAALGCTLGIVPHMLAAIGGLVALLEAAPMLFDVLRFLGVAYLLWMAWKTWTDASRLGVADSTRASGFAQVIREAVLINLLNPKLSIFFLAFLPQFVDPNWDDSLLQMGLLSAVFMLVTFAVFAVYGLLSAGILRRRITEPRVLQAIRRIFAGAFAALAIVLAIDAV